MPETIEIIKKSSSFKGQFVLPLSKSMCNRAAVIQFKSGYGNTNLSGVQSDDVAKLINILSNLPSLADAGAGGTTFRFALAALASTDGYNGLLTGTEHLLNRPIDPLLEALGSLGADCIKIDTEHKKGIQIRGKKLRGGQLIMDGNISSQFISSVLLAACNIDEPLKISFSSEITSLPYLLMTIKILTQAGKTIEFNGTELIMHQGTPKSKPIEVEYDWSSASYAYLFAAFADECEISLPGLSLQSLQGDAKISELFRAFGVKTLAHKNGITLTKQINKAPLPKEFNCKDMPDMAQTIAVLITGLKAKGTLTGLETLPFKETNRLLALKQELSKLNVEVTIQNNASLIIDASKANFTNSVSISTYHDHRMALCFAPLAILLPSIRIQDYAVVNKSWPDFWKQLQKNNFIITHHST